MNIFMKLKQRLSVYLMLSIHKYMLKYYTLYTLNSNSHYNAHIYIPNNYFVALILTIHSTNITMLFGILHELISYSSRFLIKY